MKSSLILTKMLLKNVLVKERNNEKITLKAIVKKLILFLAIAYIAWVTAFFSKEIIMALKSIYQPEAFISICLLITVTVSLLRSVLSSLSIFYFSKDVEYLLPLPISPLQIIFAKFNLMLVSSYITELITFAIPFIVYGVLMDVEWIFYCLSIFVFFTLPIIPTLLGCFFTVIMMKLTNVFKNKDVVQYITMFISLAFVIGLQVFITKTSELTTFVFANKLVEVNGISNSIANYVFILKQAINSITKFDNNEYIINAVYLLVEGLTAYLLAGIIISKLYIDDATDVVSGKRKKLIGNVKVNKKQSIAKAYIGKEFKTLFRNPTFVGNLIVPILILPILYACIVINAVKGLEATKLIKILDEIRGLLQGTDGLTVIVAFLNVLYFFNFISVTAISRDREKAVFMKYIPISFNKQCRYKAIPGFVLNLFPFTITMVLTISLIKEINIIYLLEAGFVSILCNAFISYFSLMIDILLPKLRWTSEYNVVKNNMNMLWYGIFVIIFIIIIFNMCGIFTNLHIAVFFVSASLIITMIFIDNFIKRNYINLTKKIS